MIWGCKVSHDVFTGEYGNVPDRMFGGYVTVPIMKKTRLSFCTRCGKEHK